MKILFSNFTLILTRLEDSGKKIKNMHTLVSRPLPNKISPRGSWFSAAALYFPTPTSHPAIPWQSLHGTGPAQQHLERSEKSSGGIRTADISRTALPDLQRSYAWSSWWHTGLSVRTDVSGPAFSLWPDNRPALVSAPPPSQSGPGSSALPGHQSHPPKLQTPVQPTAVRMNREAWDE